jgi:hypothetical protein
MARMNEESAQERVNLYVYFRIRADVSSGTARSRILAMQQALAGRSGVQGRLMRRREEGGTWMEVYEAVPNPAVFEAELQAAVAESGLLDLIEPGSARHVERFVECA